MHVSLVLLLLATALSQKLSSAYAEFYTYVDPNGIVHLSNVPMPGYRAQKGQKDNIIGFYIQIGPFNNNKTAERLKDKLVDKGIEAFSFEQENVSFVWFGNFTTREEATREADKLASEKMFNKYSISSPKQTYNVESTTSRLQRIANKMEDEIRSARFEVNFYTECGVSNSKPYPHISCTMYFPYSFGNMQYIHKIEALTLKKALAFAKNDSSESFEIYAVLKGGGDEKAARAVKESKAAGDFTPVCAYAYWKEFDNLYPIWPSH